MGAGIDVLSIISGTAAFYVNTSPIYYNGGLIVLSCGRYDIGTPTFNGVAMSALHNASGGTSYYKAYVMANPPIGNYLLNFTTQSGTGVVAFVLSGMKQAGCYVGSDGSYFDGGSGGPIITSNADSAIFAMMYHATSTTGSIGGSFIKDVGTSNITAGHRDYGDSPSTTVAFSTSPAVSQIRSIGVAILGDPLPGGDFSTFFIG